MTATSVADTTDTPRGGISGKGWHDPAVPHGLEKLSPAQRGLLDEWLPGAEVLTEHTWRHDDVTVLEVAHDGQTYVVKAAPEADAHIAREIAAHHNWLAPWADRAPRLQAGDPTVNILVTTRLPGEQVAGTAAEQDPAVYRQAGALLARFHAQASVEDETYEDQLDERVLAWLEHDHGIDGETEKRIREQIGSWQTPPTRLVPTHGDWQPRVWTLHDGVLGVVDLGRFEFRPAISDFVRLSALQLADDPAVETAFIEGYGSDPRQSHEWHRDQLRQGASAAVWAHRMGSGEVEAHAHQQIAAALRVLGG